MVSSPLPISSRQADILSRTGINFIFYYSTPFLKSTGAISNAFLISLIFNLVNVCSTPLSFYTVERFGRRPLLVWGAFGMLVCEFIVGIVGVTVGFNKTHLNAAGESRADNIPAVNAQIAFIAIYIFFFASTWGPGAWIVIGEIFPLPIRSRGVALSTASNWLWNTVSFASVCVSRLSNIVRSSPSSRPTWLERTRATCAPRSSSSGVVCVPRPLSTPTSSSPRPRACRWSRLTR